MPEVKTIVIALGGSVIVPDKIQINFLKKLKEFILRFLRENYKFIIVTGGGSTARDYIDAASKIAKISDEDKDWLGIHATRINAHLLRTIFKKEAYPVVLDNPLKPVADKKYRLFIASGWRPGWSTDYDAVLLAERFKTQKMIVASNIDYIYEKNFIKQGKAKPLKELDWEGYRKLISPEWKPGMKVPVDPIAARLASKLKMEIIVANGNNLKNLENIIKGKKFQGTIIHP